MNAAWLVLSGVFIGLAIQVATGQTPAPCQTSTPTRTTMPLPATLNPIFQTATAINATAQAKPTGQAPTSTQEFWTETPVGAVYRVLAPSGLNIRLGPSTNGTIIGVYKFGDTFAVVEQQTVGNYVWGKTERGWVALQNLSGTTLAAPY